MSVRFFQVVQVLLPPVSRFGTISTRSSDFNEITDFSAYARKVKEIHSFDDDSENEIRKDGSKTKPGVKVSTLEADVIATCEKVEFYGLKIANDKKNETEHLVSFSYNCRVRGKKVSTEAERKRSRNCLRLGKGKMGSGIF